MASATAMKASMSYQSMKDGKPEAENQWSVILNEVRSSTTNRLTEKNLLVLGDRESGKSTLVGKVIGKDHVVPSGVGLEHVCVPVKDDDREDSTQVNAWIVEEEEYASSLLPLVFNASNFDKTIVWLVVSMSKPWTIKQSLERWSDLLSRTIDRMKIDPVVLKDHCDKLEKQFKEYIDPSLRKVSSATGADLDSSLPLAGNALTTQLGIQIVVVVTKVDHMAVLEKDHNFRDENFDFLLIYLRSWCLRYGAALITSSAKENKNVQVLYRYTANLLYGLAFEEDGSVLDRDAVFVPIGWDNEKKIGILHEGLGDIAPSAAFESVIASPLISVKQNLYEQGQQAEDDSEFLKRVQQALQQPLQARGDVSAERRSSPAQGSPKKPDAPRGSIGGANESSLSSFFNTLLSKNNKSPAAARTASPSSTARVDAAAELERLGRSHPEESPPSNPETEQPESPPSL